MAERSLSIDEFCEAEGITRAFFYKLKDKGQAPVTYNIGRLVRVSPDAHSAWRAALEAKAVTA